MNGFDLDRRAFLRLLGGGLLVCVLPEMATAERQSGRMRSTPDLPRELASWLHVGADGTVSVFTGKAEVGQNIRTSLTQAVAEELRVPISHVRLVMADTELTPWDAGTFGSRTTPTMAPQLRQAAATARQMLISLAAKRWKVAPQGLTAKDGVVVDAAKGKRIGYGELTSGQELVGNVDPAAALTNRDDWKISGKRERKIGGRGIVTGSHRYPYDIARPGMRYGKVMRPDGFNGKLVSLERARLKESGDVTVVREQDFAAVIAPDPVAAEEAATRIETKWSIPRQPSDAAVFGYLRKNEKPQGPPQPERKESGNSEEALLSAPLKHEATYTVHYIAHVPLEPRAAVAEWQGDRLTVWTGTQRPFAVRDELAAFFRLPLERVRVIVPDTGAAYGGKHTGETALEAARLARKAGKPVKVAWTREEEFTWAYFRPAGVIEVKSGTGRDGGLLAWEFHNYNSGPAAIDTPYRVPNRTIQFHPTETPLRQGSYRALAATANNFARETHMDEIAHLLGIDPLEFRLKNIDDPRLQRVLEAAAEGFGWGKRKSGGGTGFGIAAGFEKGGYVATCAEITVAKGEIRIRRVVQAFDCGTVVNPDGLRNQVEGAIVQGIGGALFEKVRFDNGRILNPHLKDYRVPRFSDLPKIEVVIVDRQDDPSAGAGETPIIGIAPAAGNAVFAATGKRLRGLPLRP